MTPPKKKREDDFRGLDARLRRDLREEFDEEEDMPDPTFIAIAEEFGFDPNT